MSMIVTVVIVIMFVLVLMCVIMLVVMVMLFPVRMIMIMMVMGVIWFMFEPSMCLISLSNWLLLPFNRLMMLMIVVMMIMTVIVTVIVIMMVVMVMNTMCPMSIDHHACGCEECRKEGSCKYLFACHTID